MFYKYLHEKEREGWLTYKKDEPLFLHSSFGIGGNADIAVFPRSKNALIDLVKNAKRCEMPLKIFGNGTNVLFTDRGIRGVAVFTKDVCEYSFDKNMLYAECGANLARLSLVAAKAGLSGLEFASGIPGSIGGAVFMNAGAFGSEMANVVTESEYLDLDTLNVVRITDHGFSYRYSVYKDMNAVILSARIKLTEDNAEDIKNRIKEYREKRMASQPYDKKSAGSTFKRKPPYITAKLIDDAGLKGLSVGGAKVSEKHAGFIVNESGASAEDVLRLIDIVKKKVFEKFGVEIECEIIVEGEMQ